ncbi:MlaD family protein [Mailhella massiliensis]|uniref:MlaD family protein n=1 Tax=Mailhella massiliensis TaxID=1903261 RepID=UPI00097DFDE5|nr:MlaD family protein [Mailhella massiliensis]
MTERGTKTFIGFFVLGALALFIAFILLLGSGRLGDRNPTFVLYFETSLKGLTQGSPVYFKGIRIGKVASIQIRPELGTAKFYTPVIIEIERDKATALLEDGSERDVFEENGLLTRLIEAGLRGKLGISSILTGQLCVELDILRNADPVDMTKLTPYKGSPQIPTQLSSLDAALSTLENIPIQEILYDVIGSIRSMSEQLGRIDVSGLAVSLRETSDAIREEVRGFGSVRRNATAAVDAYAALASSLQKDIHATLGSVNATLRSIGNLADSSESVVVEAQGAMRGLRRTADTANSLFSEDSAPVLEFSQTMLSLRKAAQALSELATLLEIKPNALIFGRNN